MDLEARAKRKRGNEVEDFRLRKRERETRCEGRPREGLCGICGGTEAALAAASRCGGARGVGCHFPAGR